MKNWEAYTAAGVVGAALAWLLWPSRVLTPDERVTGIPVGKSLAFKRATSRAEFELSAHFGTPDNGVILAVDGQPVSFVGPTIPGAAPSRADAKAWAVMNEAWVARRRTLPAGASSGWDRNSKEAYYVPAWLLRPLGAAAAGVTTFPVDEFGRIKQGTYGDGGGLWGATFGGLLQNPLFRLVVTTALVVGTGGTGVAVLGAYTMWQNRGRELTLKNVAMQGARAYAVSQCGEACGMAFDFGAGVAAGKTVNESAETALMNRLTPEQRAYLAQGKKLAVVARA
jgi:hypothetical protein